MLKRTILAMMFVSTLVGFSQSSNKSIPGNRELVARSKSVYVESDTFFMKREQLESSLLGRVEFKAWDMRVSANPRRADLWVRVRRVPFSNHFTYTVTERETESVVMAGKVDSLAGTVYGLIADEIVHKMKVLRGAPATQPLQSAKEAAEPERTTPPPTPRNPTPQLMVRGDNNR
jgi:hypothetical protein